MSTDTEKKTTYEYILANIPSVLYRAYQHANTHLRPMCCLSRESAICISMWLGSTTIASPAPLPSGRITMTTSNGTRPAQYQHERQYHRQQQQPRLRQQKTLARSVKPRIRILGQKKKLRITKKISIPCPKTTPTPGRNRQHDTTRSVLDFNFNFNSNFNYDYNIPICSYVRVDVLRPKRLETTYYNTNSSKATIANR